MRRSITSRSTAGPAGCARCSIASRRRSYAFLKASRVKGIVGHTTSVDWMSSLVCDLLFLHRFYSDPSPWKNLRRIFNSVGRDYPMARRLGHTLIT